MSLHWDLLYSLIQTTMCNSDQFVSSIDPLHPANLIPQLCENMYRQGWVTGTGGGISIRDK